MTEQVTADSATDTQSTAPEVSSAPEKPRELDRRQFFGFSG